MIATFPYTYTYTNNEEALTPPPSGERSVDHLCRHCGQPTDDASPPGSIRDLPFLSDAWVIRASRQLNYRIQEATNLFSPSNETLVHHIPSIEGVKRRALVIIDESVQRLHGDDISRYFDYHGIELLQVPIVSQEVNKNIDNVLWISRAMHDFGLSRRTEPLIGIGGGVLLDIIGLAASLYRRGVPYIRVPTTLMGLIDAGIGIKTGVNFDRHKNRLGTYYAPVAGYLDRSFLRTLDERHMSNGLAEILKMALIKDGRLFELMVKHSAGLVTSKLQGTPEHDEIFRRAIQGMLQELEPNLWEDTLERRVDYGHSFSPDLEMKALPKLLHGEAVGIDMVFSALLAKGRGLLIQRDVDSVVTLMRRINLPIYHPLVTAEFMLSALGDTIKHRNGLQRLPLMDGIGDCTFVNDVTPQEIDRAVEAHRALGRRFGELPNG
jgi:3-dehydroquinate synthetase